MRYITEDDLKTFSLFQKLLKGVSLEVKISSASLAFL